MNPGLLIGLELSRSSKEAQRAYVQFVLFLLVGTIVLFYFSLAIRLGKITSPDAFKKNGYADPR